MNQSTFVKGTFILTVATLFSKILGSVFRIPLQNIAGDEVLGIFSLVYPVYMVALILSVAGIPIAISKLISEAQAEKNPFMVKEVYITASILALLFGGFSFSIIYLFSTPISHLLGGEETRFALIIVATTLLIAPYMAVYRGFFQGFGDMKPTAVSQVLEQFTRVGIILFIAYYLVMKNYSDDVIAGGIMSGSIIGAIISLIYLRITFVRSPFELTSEKYTYHSFMKWSKRILKISIPIAIGAITLALMNFVDSLTIPYALKNTDHGTKGITYLYGIYGRGISLVQIATVFATSIVLPLIPYITAKLENKDYQQTRLIIEKAHYMTHLISWPAALGLFSLVLPINLGLFTDLEGSWMLAIIGLSSVFTSLAILGTGILQGMNFANQAAIIIIVGVFIKALLNIGMIHFYDLTGAAISTLVVYIILFIINTYYIFKQLSFTIFHKNIWKIFLSSVVMAASIGIPTLYISIEDLTRLEALAYVFIAIMIGSAIYFFLLRIFHVIDKNEMKKIPLIRKIMK